MYIERETRWLFGNDELPAQYISSVIGSYLDLFYQKFRFFNFLDHDFLAKIPLFAVTHS